MTQIILSESTLRDLGDLTEMAEVVNERGELLGHFTPAVRGAFVPPASDGCPYSPEELERMRNEKGGRSLASILADLESR